MCVVIFGIGYVGLVIGICLVDVGYQVVCVDIDQVKVDGLNWGVILIYEFGFELMVKVNYVVLWLIFIIDVVMVIVYGQVIFIVVGMLFDEDGSVDLQYVLVVVEIIGWYMVVLIVVVNKLIVLVGMVDKVCVMIVVVLVVCGQEIVFDVVFNFEFFKEGDVVVDCMWLDCIVVGVVNFDVVVLMCCLYVLFNCNYDCVVEMDVCLAELIKYVVNVMLVIKILFMNEIVNIVEKVGVDIEQVCQGIGLDLCIGWYFIYFGVGYGGFCFFKDVQVLVCIVQQYGYEFKLFNVVEVVNDVQKGYLYILIQCYYDCGEDEGVCGCMFVVWGLVFKFNIDDMCEVFSCCLLVQLWEGGVIVCVYDLEVIDEVCCIFGECDDLVFCENVYDVLDGVDVLVVVIEWKQFCSLDFICLCDIFKDVVVFDGCNLYDLQEIEVVGLVYYGIGWGCLLYV